MNKNLMILAGEILTAAVIYVVVNTFLPQKFAYTCPFDGKEYQTTLAVLLTVVYLFSVFYATILHMLFDMAEQAEMKAYVKKEYEKMSISKNEKDSQITALENKVKTLETALENVLKNNNK